jgi:hypothetical protein
VSDYDHTRPSGVLALAEALADVLAERGLVVPAAAAPVARVLDAAAVGRVLGRDRKWVYAHARELGAFRYGDGPKARIGFDSASVERWKRARRIAYGEPDHPRRRRAAKRRVTRSADLITYDGAGARP